MTELKNWDLGLLLKNWKMQQHWASILTDGLETGYTCSELPMDVRCLMTRCGLRRRLSFRLLVHTPSSPHAEVLLPSIGS